MSDCNINTVCTYLRNLSERLNESRQGIQGIGAKPDFKIDVLDLQNGIFLCHSCILEASPSVLFQTRINAGVRDIEIPRGIKNVTRAHFDEVLTYLYTGRIRLTIHNVKIVHQICVKLSLQDLVNQCLATMADLINMDHCYDFWMYGTECQSELLRTRSLLYIRTNLVEFFKSHGIDLSFEQANEIFSKLDNNTITHEDRYLTISNWCKEAVKAPRNVSRWEINELLDHINFAEMRPAFRDIIHQDTFMRSNSDVLDKMH